MVVVDTAGIAAGFSPVKEPDWYDAVLTDYKEVESAGEQGHPMGTMEFTIEDPREDGHKCWRNYSLGTKSLMYIKGAMVELGVDPDELEGPWDTNEIIPGLLGTKCKILVRHRVYQGDTQDDVKQVRSRSFVVAGTASAKKGGSW